MEKNTTSGHALYWPVRHASHVGFEQGTPHSMATRSPLLDSSRQLMHNAKQPTKQPKTITRALISPALISVTLLPTSSTHPALSWPSPFSPHTTMSPMWPCFQKCTSEPHIPVARTWIRQSSGPGEGMSECTRWSEWAGLVWTAMLRGLRSVIVAVVVVAIVVCGWFCSMSGGVVWERVMTCRQACRKTD